MVAHAGDAPQPQSGDAMNAAPKRRSGIVLGFSFGLGLAASSGYPNDSSKLGNPAYYSSTQPLPGSGESFFVMGALADYLNFGFWASVGHYGSSDWSSKGGGGGFRVEAFPLFSLAPRLRDLALFSQFGIGTAQLNFKGPGSFPEATGVQSILGIGTFYEWRLFDMIGGHVSAGPSLEYDAIFAPSIERHGFLAGGRLVFYGGP